MLPGRGMSSYQPGTMLAHQEAVPASEAAPAGCGTPMRTGLGRRLSAPFPAGGGLASTCVATAEAGTSVTGRRDYASPPGTGGGCRPAPAGASPLIVTRVA